MKPYNTIHTPPITQLGIVASNVTNGAMNDNTIHMIAVTNIVITDMDEDYPKEVVIYNSIEAFLEDYKNTEEEVFIIGGASIYSQFINIADKIYLTEVAATCDDAQVYFPQFDKEQYEKNIVGQNEDNGISYKHVLYKRRKI